MIRENESADGKERAENASSAPSPSASLEFDGFTFNRDVGGSFRALGPASLGLGREALGP